jgi:hypothetical protein
MTGHPPVAEDAAVRTSRDRPILRRAETPSSLEAMLLDCLVDGYVEWRECARTVADAYARWSTASGPERALRFAAYIAALDQEQHAASAYGEAVSDVMLWMDPSA